ncbi:MAG TPA: hypothetical protein VGY58_09635, partial [Gemmataceae bacterium]|nr:hypothetical protein [Gemmataceae bacterium]
MVWRKWLVRVLVFSALGGMGALGLAYQAWTNPTATRQQVLDTMKDRFSGATVSLDSARLRILGGIAFNDLRLARKDDPEKQDFLYVPAGILYHDKEHLLDGKLGGVAIRKMVVQRPRFHIIRDKDGHLNLEGVIGAVNLKERVPTIVIQQGTIVFEDRTLSTAVPVVEIKDVSLTIINDPLPTLNIELSGQTDVAGPLHASLKFDRASGATTGAIDLPGIALADPLIQRVAALAPDLANHLRFLKGNGALHTTLDYDPAVAPPLRYDATLEVSDGQVTHARLPLSLEGAAATVHVVNGQIPSVHLTAHSGTAKIEITAKDLTLPSNCAALEELPALETILREFDLRIEHLQVTDKLLEQLPDTVKRIDEPYHARGLLTFHHVVQSEAQGKWRKTWHMTAEGLQASYHQYFDYPIDRITGSLETVLTSDSHIETKVNLVGFTAQQPVHLQGTLAGEKHFPEIKLEISGENIPLDEKLLAALQGDNRKLALQFLPDRSRMPSPEFQPMGLGDFKAYITREGGQEKCKNRFLIYIH